MGMMKLKYYNKSRQICGMLEIDLLRMVFAFVEGG